MWIFGSFFRDLGFLYLPGLLGVALSLYSVDLAESSLLYALIVTAFFDSGHVYTTVWRTYFHPEELRSSPTYWVMPIVFFLIFSTWHWFSFPGLWNFVVYATYYHHVRQSFGFAKWYQNLNHQSRKGSDYFLYVLFYLPLLAYHFRSGVINQYYSNQDFFLYPQHNLFLTVLAVYACTLFAWALYEYRLWRKGFREYNRILSIALPGLIYGYCFFVGRTATQVLFPLLMTHAVAYFGIMGQSLQRTRPKFFSSFGKAILIILGTALIFGFLESYVEEFIIGKRSNQTILIGLYLTPLFLHYYHDARIWRKNHREAKILLGH